MHPGFNPVAPYRYLLPNLYLYVVDIAHPDLFACGSRIWISLDIARDCQTVVTWLEGTKQVCGMTKGPPRHNKTWWWNRDVEEVVSKRKVCHKAWWKFKSAEDKHTLDVAKNEVYTAVLAAQESKLQEFTADLQS